jgi:hypothetical protein
MADAHEQLNPEPPIPLPDDRVTGAELLEVTMGWIGAAQPGLTPAGHAKTICGQPG